LPDGKTPPLVTGAFMQHINKQTGGYYEMSSFSKY
jgi:hypothetical protein